MVSGTEGGSRVHACLTRHPVLLLVILQYYLVILHSTPSNDWGGAEGGSRTLTGVKPTGF